MTIEIPRDLPRDGAWRLWAKRKMRAARVAAVERARRAAEETC